MYNDYSTGYFLKKYKETVFQELFHLKKNKICTRQSGEKATCITNFIKSEVASFRSLDLERYIKLQHIYKYKYICLKIIFKEKNFYILSLKFCFEKCSLYLNSAVLTHKLTHLLLQIKSYIRK